MHAVLKRCKIEKHQLKANSVIIQKYDYIYRGQRVTWLTVISNNANNSILQYIIPIQQHQVLGQNAQSRLVVPPGPCAPPGLVVPPDPSAQPGFVYHTRIHCST